MLGLRFLDTRGSLNIPEGLLWDAAEDGLVGLDVVFRNRLFRTLQLVNGVLT
jgi:hypothetical protein